MINLALLSAAHGHARNYLEDIVKKKAGVCRVAALWDHFEDRGRRFASEFGAEFVPDLDAVLARGDIEGFIICAETARHVPLLKATVPLGKPVFCEKPLAANVAEAREALDLIRAHNAIVHLGYFQPFDAGMRGVKKALDSGAIGPLSHARFRSGHNAGLARRFDDPDRQWMVDPALSGGGAFLDLGSHLIHCLRTLLGPVEEAFASLSCQSDIYPAVDDHGVALLRFKNGVLASVESSWIQNGGPGGLEISGNNGTIYRDAAKGYVIASKGADSLPIPAADARPTRVDRLLEAIGGRLDSAELDEDLIHAAETVAIMEACYESNRLGRWIKVVTI